MELNLVFRFGLVCLFYLMLLSYVESKPWTTPESQSIIQAAQNREQKISVPEETVSDDLEAVEDMQHIQLFASRKKSKAGFDHRVKSGIKFKIRPRQGDDNKDDEAKTVKEWTISVPKFKTNAMGNWVYNPWGITYGKVWEDTRFNIGGRATIPRMYIESNPAKDYYPYTGELDTVCVGRSTVYNNPKVMNWLNLHMYKYSHTNGLVLMKDLRRNLYKQGNPEECHVSSYTKFRDFQECSMRRNQRMEYLIPKYPMHQIPSS